MNIIDFSWIFTKLTKIYIKEIINPTSPVADDGARAMFRRRSVAPVAAATWVMQRPEICVRVDGRGTRDVSWGINTHSMRSTQWSAHARDRVPSRVYFWVLYVTLRTRMYVHTVHSLFWLCVTCILKKPPSTSRRPRVHCAINPVSEAGDR